MGINKTGQATINAAMKNINPDRALADGLKDVNKKLSDAIPLWEKLSRESNNKLINSLLKDIKDIVKLSKEATDKSVESQKKPAVLMGEIFKAITKSSADQKKLSKDSTKEVSTALGKINLERVIFSGRSITELGGVYKKQASGIVASKYEEGPAKAALGEPVKTTATTMAALMIGTLEDSVKTVVKVLSPTFIGEKLAKLTERTTMGGEKVQEKEGLFGTKTKTKLDISPEKRESQKEGISNLVMGLRIYFGREAQKQAFWKKLSGDTALKGQGTGADILSKVEVAEKKVKEPISIKDVITGFVKKLTKFVLLGAAAFLLFDVIHTWLKEKFPEYKKFTEELWKSMQGLPKALSTFVGTMRSINDALDIFLRKFGIKKPSEHIIWNLEKEKEGTFLKDLWEKASSTISFGLSEFIKGMRPKVTWSTSPLRNFQQGTDYVPETGIYGLHKGEAVIPATSISTLQTPRTESLTKAAVAQEAASRTTTNEIINLTKIMKEQTNASTTQTINTGGGLEVTRIPDKVDDVLLVLATLGAI